MILLATGLLPSAVAGLVCAVLLILVGVITVPQAYKGIDWNTCFLIGGMIPLSAAMTKIGQFLPCFISSTFVKSSQKALLQ